MWTNHLGYFQISNLHHSISGEIIFLSMGQKKDLPQFSCIFHLFLYVVITFLRVRHSTKLLTAVTSRFATLLYWLGKYCPVEVCALVPLIMLIKYVCLLIMRRYMYYIRIQNWVKSLASLLYCKVLSTQILSKRRSFLNKPIWNTQKGYDVSLNNALSWNSFELFLLIPKDRLRQG